MSERMKYGTVTVIIAAVALFFLGFWWVDESPDVGVPHDTIASFTKSNPTNFAKAGTVTVGNPGQTPGIATFVYEEPGAPARTTTFMYDEFSFCVAGGWALPCMAMSASPDAAFGGKRILIEGEKRDGTVLVRKLTVVEGEQLPLASSRGDVFIGWADAQTLIRTCNAKSVAQSHALDVYITLLDGTRVRTVEPSIDELFKVTTAAQQTCGSIPVATE